jgi:hypothetical protein
VRQVELVGGGGTGMGQAAANISALIGLLDPGATMTADGGGLVSARLRPIEGAGQIARHLIDLAGRPGDITFLERTVNGQLASWLSNTASP